jgi:hypothetical protein
VDQAFQALKKTRFMEYSDMWTRMRPAAEKIVKMPMKVKGAVWMIGAVNWAKAIGRLALVVLVFLLAVQIVPIWQNAVGTEPFEGTIFVITLIVVLAAVVMLTMSTVLDYFVRKRIIAYEEVTMDDCAPERAKMKDSVNRMMKALARETELGKETPERLSMILNFGDYDNVEVVGERQAKTMLFFKRTRTLYRMNPRVRR